MSTFKGVMEGFEDIRVDYFRPAAGLPHPRACFLSHVHSDHLQGLDSKLWNSSMIYCSPATREILLRLETRMNRIGYETKVLEARKVQYGHLEKLLKPIPLETPTQIELKPGVKLQVTLFDANHCTGAVMLLFELDNMAVLYTGDIRSEPWFVNSLSRNPLLIEYTSGIRTLDCVYIDTSHTGPSIFPPKADGLKELLQKVLKYPQDTVFHFTAWTYGYEEVWMALSKALKSQIHVNKYTYRIFESLRGGIQDKKREPTNFMIHEGPALTGYTCGNAFQPGCLTTDTNVRLHSCQKGIKCPMLNSKTVYIQPIVRRRVDGTEEAEPAIVQAGSELSGRPQIEFDSNITIDQLMTLFEDVSNIIRKEVRRLLTTALESPERVLSLPDLGLDDDAEDFSLPQLAAAILKSVTEKQQAELTKPRENSQAMSKIITFPYSRHSSYEELCSLLSIFKPKDVWPCTENPFAWHKDGRSIRELFGNECSAGIFRYDREITKAVAEAEKHQMQQISQQTQTTASSQQSQDLQEISPPSFMKKTWGFGGLNDAQNRTYNLSFPLAYGADGLSRTHITSHLGGRSPKMSRTLPFQRKEHEKPRSFDAKGKEVDLTSKSGPKDGPSELSTLRRKATPDEMNSNNMKRSRLSFDYSSLGDHLKKLGEHLALDAQDSLPQEYLKELRNQLDSLLPQESDEDLANTPGSEVNNDQAQDESGEEEQEQTFYDPVDEIVRCKASGHEIWGGEGGFCTGCDHGPSNLPYCESQAAKQGPFPQIALDENTEDFVFDTDVLRDLVGDCLDYDSSAYDTQDSGDQEFLEQYEANSFIDDEETSEPESEEEPPSSSEVDWEARFRELQTRHSRLESNHRNITIEHLELRRDIFGPDFESDDIDDAMDGDEMDGDEMDSDGLLIIDAPAPSLIATDIVLSQAREQSQDSDLSDGRLRDRAKAFEAARAGDWSNISLASVSGNHTFAEVEL